MFESYRGNIHILTADEGKKITDLNRTFFSDYIYLGKNDSINNYVEVGREIWKHFIEDEVPQTKLEELEQQLFCLQEEKDNLEMILLNTDFRLTCMELKDEGILE